MARAVEPASFLCSGHGEYGLKAGSGYAPYARRFSLLTLRLLAPTDSSICLLFILENRKFFLRRDSL